MPPRGENDPGGELPEAELREWEEGQEAEELFAGGGGGLQLFLPTPDFMASAEEE